jgi:hypothetical protein
MNISSDAEKNDAEKCSESRGDSLIATTGFEQKQRERDIIALRKKAAKLGFTLVPPEPIQVAA